MCNCAHQLCALTHFRNSNTNETLIGTSKSPTLRK